MLCFRLRMRFVGVGCCKGARGWFVAVWFCLNCDTDWYLGCLNVTGGFACLCSFVAGFIVCNSDNSFFVF